MRINEGFGEVMLKEDVLFRDLLSRVRPEHGIYDWALSRLQNPEFIETRHLVQEMFSSPDACEDILSLLEEQNQSLAA